MIRLTVLDGDEPRTLETAAELVRIGRAATNELVLSAYHVSGEHAQLVLSGDQWVVRDPASTNGTRVVRGTTTLHLMELPGRETELVNGDVLSMGAPESPVRIAVVIPDTVETARIVETRSLGDLADVEGKAFADRALVQRLYDAQRKISDAIELEQVLDLVGQQVFALLSRATHVTVALREEDDGEGGRGVPRYVPIGTRTRSSGAIAEPIPVTRAVFRKVVAERSAVLAADARTEVGETASIMGAQILSTIGVPLWHGDDITGVLQVDNRASSGVFKTQDLDLMLLLAQSIASAVANARLYQRLAIAEERQRKENTYLKRREKERRDSSPIGESSAMRALFAQVRKVVDTRVTVLIEGETGTGKELIASAVHYWSNRRERLFVAQNCAALPENLLESELFGHKKGAFTGATDEKKGLFELADQGTLFLDEVGELPLSLQAKLLRALQEGEIRPVGATSTKRVDVRIVAATNRDLEKEVREGRFREDLYYRLRVFPLRVPKLSERREDIPLLAAHFLRRYEKDFGKSIGGFSQQAMEMLQAHDWPGNVRELENEIQRLVIQLDAGDFVQPEHLSPRMRRAEGVLGRVAPAKGTLREMVDSVEKHLLLEALREHGNNKSATAKTLGITREGLHKKLKGFGIG